MRILQITAAAPGWWALYRDESHSEPVREPIAVWALVENSEDDTYVTALNLEGDGADGAPVELTGNFIRIVYDPLARHAPDLRQ